MELDAADITPPDCQLNLPKKETESAPPDAYSEIDSIVLNAPVADVYACCSRFEELPRFITSLRDLQKIDETHFSFTSLLDGKPSDGLTTVAGFANHCHVGFIALNH
jgi:hypothetical protein